MSQKTEKNELTASQAFSTFALKEFGSQVAGETNATEYQKQLIQGYFIGIDRALKVGEDARVRKNERNTNKKYNNNLPINWNTMNLKEAVLDAVHYAKMGLDMMQSNHLTAIPFKNSKTNQYDVTFIKGYEGIKYIAEKYALDKPKNVITELVYSTDRFQPVKKSVSNKVENYEFEITNPFDRGNVMGGFGYIEYEDSEKNQLIIMTMRDIEKRKPKYASAEFWGGKTKEWKNGKQVEVETDGWFEEMCHKTLERYIYGKIEIDPMKIDENYQYMRMAETRYVESQTQALIEENANTAEFVLPYEEPAEEEIIDEIVQEETESSDPEWVNSDI